jgi:hypothetical protein
VYIHADSSLSTLSIGKIGRASKLLLEVKFCKSAICDDQLFCVSAQLSGEAMAKARSQWIQSLFKVAFTGVVW